MYKTNEIFYFSTYDSTISYIKHFIIFSDKTILIFDKQKKQWKL